MRITGAALAALIALTGAVGCTERDSAVTGDRLAVTAAFYPLAFVTERVGGERVSVDTLAKPGVEPHDVELTPQQTAALESVDLVVYLRGFQPALDDAVGAGNSLNVAAVEPLADADPHVWLDPTRLAEIAGAVADRLAVIDPEGAASFAQRAAGLTADLEALDAAFTAGLKTCRLRQFVTSHDAFGYLASRYLLEQVGISGLDPEADPSPARLRAVAKFVREKGVGTIFFETLLSPKVARTIAAETGADTAVLDPVESVANGSADDYLVVMRRNLDALRTALGCT
ncbi:MAG TPA: metal ABC transporter substrate-binding protein [Mycobacteriales bacterium]|nr:metal ABC transporter substrate-binding protein [Mycobacteriales bacterium]